MPDETDVSDPSAFSSASDPADDGEDSGAPADDSGTLPQDDPGGADGGDGSDAPDDDAPEDDPDDPAANAVDVAPAPPSPLRNLPEKPVAALYNAMTADWGDPMTAICRDLTLKQYQGAGAAKAMTVDELMNLPAGGIGVLVMFAHGVIVQDAAQNNVFCIATSQVVTPADDARFANDLHPPGGGPPTLITHDVPMWPDGAAGRTPQHTQNYCITAAFVRKYWPGKFCKNSLAMFCSCSLLDQSLSSSVDFVDALQSGAGVSYLVGWDGEAITRDMATAGIFLFDRLLGANDPAVTQEVPPQRPFDITAVLENIGQFQNLAGGPLNISQGSLPNVQLAPAHLAVSEFGDNSFGILAPSILYLGTMMEQTRLAIAGAFGDDPGPDRGVVRIDGAQVPYESWAPDQIVCPLLVSDAGPVTGAAAGMVVVEVDGRPSNAVPLTEWRGKLVFTVNGDGAQKIVCTWTYHLKADVHRYRVRPGSDASCYSEFPLVLFSLKDSSLVYAASGTEVTPGDPPQHVTWSGSGTVKPWGPDAGMSDSQDTFVVSGRIVRPPPPDLDGTYLLLGVGGGDKTWTYQVDADGDSRPNPAFRYWESLCTDSPGPLFEDGELKLPLDHQMSIAAGTYPFTVDGWSCQLSIQPEPTRSPPDPSKGEDQSVEGFGWP